MRIKVAYLMLGLLLAVAFGVTGCGGGGGGGATVLSGGVTAAKAGSAQTVVVGTLVTLDGSQSTAAEGCEIKAFQWSFASKPVGSAAALQNPAKVSSTFTPDLPGLYSVKLSVTDTDSDSAQDSVTITAIAGNAAAPAPVANAGTAQTVVVGTLVRLDGSASSAANGAPLTYSWSFSSKPSGSGALLTTPTAVNPTFTPDLAGSYVVALTVNDGKLNSAAATVTITATARPNPVPNNTVPVANAGPAQSVYVGAVVTLDGSASYDADGDPLTYRWAFGSLPAGSAALLSGATALKPSFTPDVVGVYVVSLIVNDGKDDSTTATVTVTATTPPGPINVAPVANAGSPQYVLTGSLVTLDGSGSSDANGDALSYRWALSSRPAGSAAPLSSTTVVKPSFTSDLAGSYVFTLVVNDGALDSAAAQVTVTASTPNTPPVAKAGTNQTVVVGTPVTLDGSGSSDADGDALTYRWALVSAPSGSSAALSSTTVAKPSFTPDAVANYVFSLIVNDGKADSVAATVTITSIANNGSISILW